jgi:hypothetical protein
MLIGISGLAGSGKSEIAFALQKKGFLVIALADPIKRIAKEIYDFTDDQLWGPSAMRSTPDPRYIQSSQKYHSLIPKGPKGAPNNLFCTHCREYFDDREVLKAPCVVYLTARHVLQQLGTELGRSCYLNTWVDLAIRTTRQVLRKDGEILGYSATQGILYGQQRMYFPENDGVLERASGVVIPDIRFKNEFDAVRTAGGYLIRVTRSGSGLSGGYAAHASEVEQREIPDEDFDLVLRNDRTLEDLYENVELVRTSLLVGRLLMRPTS